MREWWWVWQSQFPFHRLRLAGAVVEQERIAVGTEHIRHVQDFAIFQRLLHPAADRMIIIFGFHHCQTDARFVAKEEIGALGFATAGFLTANQNPALGEIDFPPNLIHQIPFVASRERRYDELGADVTLAQLL